MRDLWVDFAIVLRTLSGFAVAPLVPAILLSFGSALFADHAIVDSAFILSFLFGYPTALLFGVPAHLLLCRVGWVRVWHYGALGVVSGAVPPVTLYVLDLWDRGRLPTATDFVINDWGIVAFVLSIGWGYAIPACLTLWFVVRPDQTESLV